MGIVTTPLRNPQGWQAGDLSPGVRRPFAFLVSTTGCARRIDQHLGSAAYSYHFVVEALAPVLERLGTWQLVERPESRLPYLADKATAAGFRPVHLAINPLQDCYFTRGVPTVVFPFWEFPDLPNRDFGHDTRQNWLRLCRAASLVITACRFTADAFRRAGVRCPIAVVPVPLPLAHFELPDWDPQYTWTTTCRHVVWDQAAPAGANGLGPKRSGVPVNGRPGLGRRLYMGVRAGYRRHVRRWLSDEAQRALVRIRDRALARLGRAPLVGLDPVLPAAPLEIGGLVYTTFFSLGDARKNYVDLLSAFLLAFRDRPDVTLVIKLVTNPVREHHELSLLRQHYLQLGVRHRCRVVVITDYLTDAQMRELMRTTTYYVNTSHAEGACLPLQQALAGGRPGLAPAHSAMADYLDGEVGFVLRSDPEPAPWPHDPTRRLTTSWHRLVWSDIYEGFLASAAMAEFDQVRYQSLAARARKRMRAYAGPEVVEGALRRALELLPDWPTAEPA